MGVSFYLLNGKRSGNSSIMTTVSFRNNVFKLSSGITCLSDNWNSDKYQVTRKDKNYATKNFKLNEFRTAIEKELNMYYTFGMMDFSYDKFKKKIIYLRAKIVKGLDPDASINLSGSGGDSHESLKSVLDYFNEFIERRKNNPNFGRSTVDSYMLTKRHLENFMKHNNIELTYNSFDSLFYENFITYLSYDLNMMRNSVGFVIKTLKTFLQWSLDEEYHSNIKFKKSFKVWKEKTNQIALTESEIKMLEDIDLSSKPDMDVVRDLFLFALYTGFRISDLKMIQNGNIDWENKRIKLVGKKMKKIIGAPIGSKLEIILRKYPDLKLLKIDKNTTNRKIKTIAKEAGITSEFVKTIYIGNIRKDITYPRHDMIGMHTAKRTYSTIAEKKKVSRIAIINSIGHENREVHDDYVKIEMDEAIEMTRVLWD